MLDGSVFIDYKLAVLPTDCYTCNWEKMLYILQPLCPLLSVPRVYLPACV